jgi:magnesium-transporting ATPase (P-type)
MEVRSGCVQTTEVSMTIDIVNALYTLFFIISGAASLYILLMIWVFSHPLIYDADPRSRQRYIFYTAIFSSIHILALLLWGPSLIFVLLLIAYVLEKFVSGFEQLIRKYHYSAWETAHMFGAAIMFAGLSFGYFFRSN